MAVNFARLPDPLSGCPAGAAISEPPLAAWSARASARTRLLVALHDSGDTAPWAFGRGA